MKWSIGAKISGGFALALAILVVIGVVSYRDSTGLIASADWVTHTYQVLTGLDGIIKAMEDVETGERGFIIAGADPFLEPYTSGKAAVEAMVKDVRQLTSDNPSQQKRLDDLETLIASRLEISQAGIDARRTSGFKAAQDMVASGRGKKVMDEIRAVDRDDGSRRKSPAQRAGRSFKSKCQCDCIGHSIRHSACFRSPGPRGPFPDPQHLDSSWECYESGRENCPRRPSSYA